jgi:hypothetical protein
MCFSHCAWPRMFSEASISSTGDFLLCKGDSEKGEVSPKDGGAVRVGGSTERFDDMLLAAKRLSSRSGSWSLGAKKMSTVCVNRGNWMGSFKKRYFVAWLVEWNGKKAVQSQSRKSLGHNKKYGLFISFGRKCKADPTVHPVFQKATACGERNLFRLTTLWWPRILGVTWRSTG